MSRIAKVLVALATVVVVLIGVAFGAWYFFLRSEPKPRAKITNTKVAPGGALDGTYSLQSGDPQSFVGYRVQEQFAAAVLEDTATGRTSTVTGSLSIHGATARDVSVTADLRTLKSDRDLRDNRIKSIGLESDKFPDAKFVLGKPVDFGHTPRPGETVTTDAVGALTLHGTTKTVKIPVDGRWDGRDVQVVGHLPITFADYGMDAPNIGGFVSVRDRGEMEFQLFFHKTSGSG